VQLGMIGLGRMGANMVRRLMRAGHECVVFDRSPDAVQGMAKEGALGASDLDDFVARLHEPRAIWLPTTKTILRAQNAWQHKAFTMSMSVPVAVSGVWNAATA
jgi:6-phosphogluconate dehydrogenase